MNKNMMLGEKKKKERRILQDQDVPQSTKNYTMKQITFKHSKQKLL